MKDGALVWIGALSLLAIGCARRSEPAMERDTAPIAVQAPAASEGPAPPAVPVRYEGSRWGPPRREFGFVLDLKADGTYRLSASGESGGQWSTGTWQATEDGVALTHGETFLAEYLPEWTRAAGSRWKLQEDRENLLFLYRLTTEAGDSLWSVSYPVPSGTQGVLQGRTVIREGERDSVTLDDARLRDAPGVTGTSLALRMRDGDMVEREYVPRGHAVRLLARTESRDAVQDWNDYWYYVSVVVDDGAYGREYRGWMYGALLRK